MIIKKIIIENFRSFYGENIIEFNDGLNIFIGDNGDGKTTFFEALKWLFDTAIKNKSEENRNLDLISEKRISEMFESNKVRVAMFFEHDGEKRVEKSFCFKVNNDKQIETSDFEFKGTENRGSEKIPIDGKVLLDDCFEMSIRKYCLFKGEDDLNIFNNFDGLNFLIETFSNVKQFDIYYSIKDDESFTNFAEKKSDKAFATAMQRDGKNKTKEETLRLGIESLKRELNELKDNLKKSEKNATDYSKKIKEFENSRGLSESLNDCNDRLEKLRNDKKREEKLIDENYSIKLLDERWILYHFPNIFKKFQNKISVFSKERRRLEKEEDIRKGKEKGKKEMIEKIKNNKSIALPHHIPSEIIMQEMLEDEICKVCGRDAPKGSAAYSFMQEKVNKSKEIKKKEIKKEEKDFFQNNFVKELEKKYNQLEYESAIVNNLKNTISKCIENNENQKNKVKEIEEKIEKTETNKKNILSQSNNLGEKKLVNIYENLTQWYDSKSTYEKKNDDIKKEIEKKSSELDELEKEYGMLSENSTAEIPKKIHDVFADIKKAFKNAKEKNTQDFLEELEKQSNVYLERINVDHFRGILKIIRGIGNKTKIELQDSNNKIITSPNQALNTTMYMSVLFAVSDLTSLKRENDYPLIFDAPTSSFSSKKESDFFNIISSIKKQCVIFTKSFLNENGEIDNDKIERQKCTIYRMRKKRPFDHLDLSTVQTELKRIK
ncbi:MAG: AAA family ATPase [Flavobacteriaceae bacterium]|nr:AAA family ATPase [Flavobacteriaceae bacterium]